MAKQTQPLDLQGPWVDWDWVDEVPSDTRQLTERFVAWLVGQHPTCSVTEVLFIQWGDYENGGCLRRGMIDHDSGVVNVYCDGLSPSAILLVVGHEFAHNILGKGVDESACDDWGEREVAFFLAKDLPQEFMDHLRTPEGEAAWDAFVGSREEYRTLRAGTQERSVDR
jgi:hypothetical protein